MTTSERRTSPRVPISVYVEQHVEGQTHRCFASDLSLSGAYMERPLSSFVRHSAEIELEIPLPDGESDPLWATCEVVYDSFDALFHGTAVRFTGMSQRHRARLSAFLGGSGGPDQDGSPAA